MAGTIDPDGAEDGTARAMPPPAAPAQAPQGRSPSGRPADARRGAAPAAARRQAARRASQESPQDRLRLNRDQAEAVLRRALELQDARPGVADDRLSLADVQDVARQVGVDPSLVRRAMTDVRLATMAEHEPSRTERLLGPRRIASAVVVPGDPTATRVATIQWMVHEEGMKLTGSRVGAHRFVKDKRMLVELQRGLRATKSEGVLRDIQAVTVELSPDVDGTIVSVNADTSNITRTTTAIAAGSAVAGTIAGVAFAAAIPDGGVIGSDVGQFVVTFAGWAALGLGTATAVGRTWASKVRNGVEQALDGIAMTTSDPSSVHPIPHQTTGWRRTAVRWLGGNR